MAWRFSNAYFETITENLNKKTERRLIFFFNARLGEYLICLLVMKVPSDMFDEVSLSVVLME